MAKAHQTKDSARLGPAVARLLGGSLGGQCLLLLAAPVLSRLYTPADFGAFGVFFSLIAMGTTVGTLRYEMAIVLARRNVTIRRLFWAATAIAVVMSVVAMAALAGFPVLAKWIFPTNNLHHVWWLLPTALLVHNVMLTTSRVASKVNAFGRLGVAVLLGRGADLAVKIALASTMDWHGLVLGMIAGDVVSTAVTLLAAPKLIGAPPTGVRRYLTVLRRYRHFPIYNLPGALGSAIARAIPVIGLGMLFGPIAAGSYEMASRVLGRPSALVGNQFYTVFYPKSVAQLAQGKSIAGMVELWMPRLLLLFAPPFLLVAFFGRPLFAFVFGSQWSDAGLYAAILAPAWYVGGVATPIRVFNSLGEQRLALVWQGVVVVGTATAMAFGPVLGGDITTVALVSTVWTLAYLVHLGITIRLSGADPRRIWTGLFAPLRRSSGAQLADRLAGAPTTIDSPAPTPSLRQSA